MREPHVVAIDGRSPRAEKTTWVAPTAAVIGAATLGAETSVWYGAVLRADCDSITLGEGSNIQDGVAVHVDPGFPSSSAGTSVWGTTPSCTAAPWGTAPSWAWEPPSSTER